MIEETGRFGLSLLCRNPNFTDDPYKVASLTTQKEFTMTSTSRADEIAAIRQDPLNEKLLKAMEEAMAPATPTPGVDADESQPVAQEYDVYDREEGLLEFQKALPIVLAMMQRRYVKIQNSELSTELLAVQEIQPFVGTGCSDRKQMFASRGEFDAAQRKKAIEEANAWSDFCDFIIHCGFKAPIIEEHAEIDGVEIDRLLRRVNIDFDFVKEYLEPHGIRIIRDARKFSVNEARDYHTTPFVEFTVDGEKNLVNLILTPIYYVGWFRLVENITSELEDLAGKYVEASIEEVAAAEAAKAQVLDDGTKPEPWLLDHRPKEDNTPEGDSE